MNTDDLHLHRDFYPQGRALRLLTNSPEVLEHAASLWEHYPALSDSAPVTMRISVSNHDADLVNPSACRIQRRRILIRAGRDNWAVADLRSGLGRGYFTSKYLRRADHWRYHFLEPLGYTLIAARHFTLLHAAAISHAGRAILLCGESGAGKTSMAFAAARKRWTYVSGDATALIRNASTPRIIGRPFEIRFRRSAMALFPELRDFPAKLRANGKVDFELDPSSLNIPRALEAEAVCVVVLDRVERELTSIQKLSRETCKLQLLPSLCFGDSEVRRDQMQTLERLLDLPLFRLRYSALDSAEEALWSLLQESMA